MDVTGTWKDEADAIQAEAIATIKHDMAKRAIGRAIPRHRFTRRAALLCGQSQFAMGSVYADKLRSNGRTVRTVREQLANARENGETFEGWTDADIAADLIAYSSDFEQWTVEKLEPFVAAARNA